MEAHLPLSCSRLRHRGDEPTAFPLRLGSRAAVPTRSAASEAPRRPTSCAEVGELF